MTERRPWTEEQDLALKHLKQDLNIKKWSEIAKLMESEYFLPGRSGKQCRERYHNHLDKSIILKDFTLQEEKLLFKIHSQIGNRWSVIARQFSGRTDNFLKNHFHSKLRKAIRKLNKQIKEKLRKNSKSYKLSIIYKIVEASDFKFCSNLSLFIDQALFFQKLKNQLLFYAGGETIQTYFSQLKQIEVVQYLMKQLEQFQINYKKHAGKNSKKQIVLQSKQHGFASQNKCQSTSNSQCESQMQDQSFECFKDIQFKMEQKKKSHSQTFKQNSVPNNQNLNSKLENKSNSTQKSQKQLGEENQKINARSFYSFVLQNAQIRAQYNQKQKEGIEHLIQQEELPFLQMGRKLTFSECGSMKMIDQSYQFQDSQLWMKRLQSYSNIDEALFE